MKTSLSWLRRYVDIPWDAEELAQRLTDLGLEVDGVEQVTASFTGVTVGKVRAVRPHPDADKLRLATVDTGAGTQEVVCGAPNCREGLTVAYAGLGATLVEDFTITRRKIRGIESCGMLCSEDELGLTDERQPGILELDDVLVAGTPLEDALSINDTVFDLAITANRGDCLGHLGVAREIAALTGGAVRTPPQDLPRLVAGDPVPVDIQDPERCARYIGRVVEGLGVAPSPLWMRRLLTAVGVRPINNLVDVTNFVLFEYGQPLHAFDLRHVRGGRIVVRTAAAGERMHTLDEVERTFESTDLLICDGEGPVAVAGVMGGLDSEVKDDTTHVLLESAWFHPPSVRGTSRRLGLHSESSHRFEREIDPEMTLEAANRALHLMCALSAPGTAPAVVESFTDNRARRVERPVISYRPSDATRLLGLEIPAERQREVLGRLGFTVEERGDGWQVRAPSWRGDVGEGADLVEEVGRVVGYDAIPTPPARVSTSSLAAHGPYRRLRALRRFLCTRGLHQALNYSFLGRDLLAHFEPDARPLDLLNPLSEDQRALRTLLAPRLVANAGHNLRHGAAHVRLFEVGQVFHANAPGELPDETLRLGIVLAGPAGEHWSGKARPVDFFDLKGLVEDMARSAGFALRVEPTDTVGWLHPGASARAFVGDTSVGVLGVLHPRVARELDLGVSVVCAELDLGPLVDDPAPTVEFRDFARLPASTRDLALRLPDAVVAAQVLAAIEESGAANVDRVEVFDIYRGESVGPGMYSLGLRITYRASDRTLTDEEVSAAHGALVERLEGAFGATQR